MKRTQERIKYVIHTIQQSHPDIERLYMEGQCYNFYKILTSIFGDDIECWYDFIEGHIYTKIGNFWYDIRGEHTEVSETCRPVEESTSISDPPENWGARDRRYLSTIPIEED